MSLAPRPLYRWQLRTHTLELGSRTHLMAIVNITPDSFSGDGLSKGTIEEAIASAVRAHDSGADILDLGAESTRPGAIPISATEEQARLLPVLEALMRERPQAVVSVDTYHASTARAAIRLGVEIVNDVSGLEWDSDMARTVAESGCGLVLMHARGRPTQWKLQTRLPPSKVLPTVFSGLCERLTLAEASGLSSERILLDPGFGFGKVDNENVVLLAGLPRLHELGRPLLVGLSRKSFLAKLVQNIQGTSLPIPEARRVATTTGNVAAILAGAHVLRVHELQPAREAAAVADALLEAEEPTLRKVVGYDA
jgi:dihydropteroate synthase